MTTSAATPPAIWIDLENTPHVPFFLPIILELEALAYPVIITARDFAQTRALAEEAELTAKFIGGEYGNSAVWKTVGILLRGLRLAAYLRGKSVTLAVGHGSRGLLIAAKLLGIRTLTLYDYEGASVGLFNKLSDHVMTPEVLTYERLAPRGLEKRKHLTYPGLKEEVYTADFIPTNALAKELGLAAERVIVTIRPPSLTAHYRSDESFRLFDAIMQRLLQRSDLQIVLLPRNAVQRTLIEKEYGSREQVVIPKRAVHGLDLVWLSDLVIGGGGTMNREAAALRVPVLSIFKGPMGAVDEALIADRRMREIESAEEIDPFLVKRTGEFVRSTTARRVRDSILEVITALAGKPKR